MAFEAVDACFGTPHISSDDLAALNEATIGKRDCVMKWGDDFKAVMTNANTCLVGTGVGMVGGKRFWNQAAVSLTVQGGTQGQKRNDLVVARYAKTSAGIESISPVVIKGTPTTDTPADPAVTANDLKLWRIPLDGINAGEPVRLFDPVTPLAAIGDSVCQDTGWVDLYSDSKWGFVRFRAKAGICSIQVSVYGIKANDSWKVPLVIHPRFLPEKAFYAPLAHRQSNNVAQLWVPAKGGRDLYLYIYTQVDANLDNYVNGVVSYFY